MGNLKTIQIRMLDKDFTVKRVHPRTVFHVYMKDNILPEDWIEQTGRAATCSTGLY